MLTQTSQSHRHFIVHAMLATGLLGWVATGSFAQSVPQREPLTVAEASGFTATATGEEVHQFLAQLAAVWPGAELGSMGTTTDGRTIDMLTVPAAQGIKKGDSKPLTVLILGGIHAGECDGKEALLALARDWSQNKNGAHRQVNLILVPNFNADGDARRGAEHRPGQLGPTEGMGVRENAQGLDLNRDFIKLESPEVRSLVKTFHERDVDVLLDLHTTNGSLHRYPLTYDIPHNPAAPANLDRYLRDELIPGVTNALAKEGLNTFYYGNFSEKHDRWESYGHEPRYSTEYMGLQGKIGILVESYSYASYQARFEATYRFVNRVLDQLVVDSARIRAMIDEQSKSNVAGASVPVAGKLTKTSDDVKVLGYQKPDGTPPGDPYAEKVASELAPKEYSVQLWNSTDATNRVTLPAAYAIDPQYAWAVSRLLQHGLQITRLANDEAVFLERAEITKVSSGEPFQGHRLTYAEGKWQTTEQTLPKGTYIIPATGPLGRLAAYLLEPMSDDSLATWNFFDPYLTVGAEYPVRRLSSIPSSAAVVKAIEPGEVLTLDRVMKVGSTIDLGGGNRFQMVRWSDGSETSEYMYMKDDQWYTADAATGATRRVEQNRQFEEALSKSDVFDANEARSIARRTRLNRSGQGRTLISHRGDLYVYDAAAQSVIRLTNSSDKAKDMAELNPVGTHAAFVRDNNLWVVDADSATERQLTTDGSTELLNGILDWVYQEELYGRGNFKAFWWSPDGRHLAFLQLDQTEVPEYIVLDSVTVAQSVERTRYPKAGQPNPKVKVFVADVQDSSIRQLDLSGFAIDDLLIGRVSWSPDNHLWLQAFNRVQNRQDLVRVDPISGTSTTVLKEETKGWLEIRGTPTFLATGDFLWLSDIPDGRTHLYWVDAKTGQRRALTHGDWDVSEILSVSKDQKTVFVAGNPGQPIDKHLIVVDVESSKFEQVTKQPGTHNVSVDSTGTYFIDTYSNIASPPVTSLHRMDGQLVRVLSAPTRDRHSTLKIQPPKQFTIAARDGLPLQAQVMLPWGVDFDLDWGATLPENAKGNENGSPVANRRGNGDNAQKKLPVLFYVYAGPQAPTVMNAWQQRNDLWHQVLCTNGYAVVQCDNRSSRGRGVGDAWTIRGDMGRIELQDIEDAVAWVKQQPWADPDRIGIWGWSYGGYMTAYALTHSKSFKAGISGAPVTDWHNYDSIYTERYMDLPKSNKDGYKSSSVVQAAADLHGRLLLIHGERDDNVHLANTLQFVNALQASGKQFDLMIYPRARHGVVDPRQRYQMHRMMTDFLDRNLKGD